MSALCGSPSSSSEFSYSMFSMSICYSRSRVLLSKSRSSLPLWMSVLAITDIFSLMSLFTFLSLSFFSALFLSLSTLLMVSSSSLSTSSSFSSSFSSFSSTLPSA